MLDKFESLDQELKKAEEVQDSSEIQLHGLHVQAKSISMQIENLIGNKGKIPNRLELINSLNLSKIHSAYESEHFLNEIERCQGQIDRSLASATKDCERTKREEVCPEDGQDCYMKDVPDPVEGSCEAASSIPFLTQIVDTYDEHSLNVAPSALMSEGFSNLIKKYDRYASMNVPQGRWSSSLNRCQASLSKLYTKTEAVCGNVREDGEDIYEWNIPQEGDFVTDMYESILGRSPDNPGFHYWNEAYKKLENEGKSKEEIILAIKDGFYESAEYLGDEEKIAEIEQKNQQYARDNNLEIRECTKFGCLKDKERPKSDAPRELSAEAKQRLDRLGEEAMKFLTATMNKEDFELLVNMSLESFSEVDLFIGQSFLRTNLIEGLEESVKLLNEQDNIIVNKLNENLHDVNKIIEKMKSSRVSSQGSLAKSMNTNDETVQYLGIVQPEIQSLNVTKSELDKLEDQSTDKVNDPKESGFKTSAIVAGISRKSVPNDLTSDIVLRTVKDKIKGTLSKNSGAISPRDRKALSKLKERKEKMKPESLQALKKSQDKIFNGEINNPLESAPSTHTTTLSKEPLPSRGQNLSKTNKEKAPAPYKENENLTSSKKGTKGQYRNNRVRNGRRSSRNVSRSSSSTDNHSRKQVNANDKGSRKIDAQSAGRFVQRSGTGLNDVKEVGSRDENIFQMITNRYQKFTTRLGE